jgi:hypothetical protein
MLLSFVMMCSFHTVREPDALVVVPCRDSGGSGTDELQQLIDRGASVRFDRFSTEEPVYTQRRHRTAVRGEHLQGYV